MVAIRQNNLNRKMVAKSMSPNNPASERDRAEVDKSLEQYYKYIVKLVRIQIPEIW